MDTIITNCEKEIPINYNSNEKRNSIINDCILQKTESIKKDLDNQLKKIKKNKFTRYFTKHKGRTFLIFCCIILLIVCIYNNIPITGDMPEEPKDKLQELEKKIEINKQKKELDLLKENEKELSNLKSKINFYKFLSLFGFVASNLILALLVSVIGVETFLSREELSEVRNEEKKLSIPVILKVRKKFKKPNKNTLQKLKNLINKYHLQPTNITKYEVKTQYGKNENTDNKDILLEFNNNDNDNEDIDNYLNIIESSIKNDISLDEEDILNIINELDKITNE